MCLELVIVVTAWLAAGQYVGLHEACCCVSEVLMSRACWKGLEGSRHKAWDVPDGLRRFWNGLVPRCLALYMGAVHCLG